MRHIVVFKRNWVLGLVSTAIAFPGAVFSQDRELRGVSLGPGMRLETAIEGRTEFTDNKYWTSQDEVDAFGVLLLPEINLSYVQSAGEYQLRYQGELAEYDTTSRDDYFDHLLSFEGDYQPLTRHGFGLEVNYRGDHDDFGTSRTSGIVAVNDRYLDEWDQFDGAVRYTYGAPSATLNWHLRGVFKDKEYDTNRIDPLDPTTGTRFLDHSSNGFGGGLSYTISPRTKAIVDLEHREIDYKTDFTSSFDGSYEIALVGVRWEASGKTAGEFLVGGFSREFDDSARDDVSGVSWQGRVLWALRSYSTVIFQTGQRSQEHYLLGENLISVEYLDVEWRHDWTATVHSNFGLGIQEHDFEGITRTDDLLLWSAGLEVEMAPRYLLSLGYKYIDRESSATIFDLDRSTVLLSLKATF